jgi:hypothetical protein
MIAIILAAAVWVVLSFVVGFGPMWPIELIFGQGGCLGFILAGAWWALVIYGFVA